VLPSDKSTVASIEGSAGAAAANASPPSSEALRLPLGELAALGWTWQRGASCQLVTPLGKALVAPPDGGVWSMHGAQLLALPPFVEWLAVCGIGIFLVGISGSQFAILVRWGLLGRASIEGSMLVCFLTCSCCLGIVPIYWWIAPGISAMRGPAVHIPHLGDMLSQLNRGGYRVQSLCIYAAVNALWGALTFALLQIFLSVAAGRWLWEDGLLFERFIGPGVPSQFRALALPFAMFASVLSAAYTVMVTSMVFHMWHRDGGRHALQPHNEQDSWLLIQP